MNLLVVGGGGREHCLAWAFHRVGGHRVQVCPGNPGTASFAVNVSGDPFGVALRLRPDLVVVGPEAPLADGLADRLRAEGIPCFGPGAEGARLESSKWFAKMVMKASGVPTPQGEVFHDFRKAMEFLGETPGKWVIKADGLAAGKGVVLPETTEDARQALTRLFALPSGRVVVEERLTGPEVSIMAVCNGNDAVMLPPSRDHKRVGEGDTGPNTGGMGAVCPPRGVSPSLAEELRNTVILPVLHDLSDRGVDFRGVLYAGMMLTPLGPRVLEFNVRFGDPETQAVLPLLEGDLAEVFLAAARGESLAPVPCRPGASATVVLASSGYPGAYRKGLPILGLEEAEDVLVFHAGTGRTEQGLVTDGGRVLGITALGPDLDDALKKAYTAIRGIHFEGMHYRKDIGRSS